MGLLDSSYCRRFGVAIRDYYGRGGRTIFFIFFEDLVGGRECHGLEAIIFDCGNDHRFILGISTVDWYQ
jgi:hypothetical protein